MSGAAPNSRAPLAGAGEPHRDGDLVCYCFGVGRSDLARAAAAGDPEAPLRRIVAEVRAGRCACEVKNPAGHCCLGELRREIDALGAAAAGQDA